MWPWTDTSRHQPPTANIWNRNTEQNYPLSYFVKGPYDLHSTVHVLFQMMKGNCWDLRSLGSKIIDVIWTLLTLSILHFWLQNAFRFVLNSVFKSCPVKESSWVVSALKNINSGIIEDISPLKFWVLESMLMPQMQFLSRHLSSDNLHTKCKDTTIAISKLSRVVYTSSIRKLEHAIFCCSFHHNILWKPTTGLLMIHVWFDLLQHQSDLVFLVAGVA